MKNEPFAIRKTHVLRVNEVEFVCGNNLSAYNGGSVFRELYWSCTICRPAGIKPHRLFPTSC